MRRLFIAFFAIILIAYPLAEAGTQKYTVKGKFMCGNTPSPGAQTSVKMLDKSLGPDTNMGKMKVDSSGSFRIDGTSSGITSIDPELHIYTDCDDGVMPGQRRLKLKLPKKYIGNAGGYDIGTINLESHFKDSEDRDVWH
jgi:hypothetical protein